MSKAQYALLVGLLFVVLSKVTFSGLQNWWAFAGWLTLAYFVVVEVVAWWQKRQMAKQPPFALQTQLYFETQEERNTFADRMRDLVQELRREKDPTNGLSPEKLDEMREEQASDQLSEEGQRYFGVTESPVEEPVKKARKPRTDPKVSAKEAVRRYKKEKQSVAQISTEMGYADTTNVYKFLRAAGVKFKKGRPRRG